MEGKKDSLDILSALSDGMAKAVDEISPAVVRVNGRRRRSASGVVYAPRMVLTASHVLEREEDLSVVAGDGDTHAARLVGRDTSSDLAVLRVEGLEVRPAAPAEDTVRVGQLALAVGRGSRGEGTRASLGIVSAVGGPLRTRWGTRLERYIQTDAVSYPGFSGGTLIGARGEVLGIVTTGLSRGTALAIPGDIAWRTAHTLSEKGSIKRGYLGILSQPVRLPDARRIGLTQRTGLLVVGVEEGSPADASGLIVGDILAALDGQPVEDTEDLLALLTGERVGAPVPIKVVRGGEPKTLEVTVGERG